jgi:hypothetical protein
MGHELHSSLAGFVKVRCVDDPSSFLTSKSVSPHDQPSSIYEEEEEDGEEGEDRLEELQVSFCY